MSATARTTAPSRREKDSGHHAAPCERVDVHGVAPTHCFSVSVHDLLDHVGISRQTQRQRSLHVIRPQRSETFGHAANLPRPHPANNISHVQTRATLANNKPNSASLTFRAFRFGALDPAVHLGQGTVTMASCTPNGPAWTSVNDAGDIAFGGPGAAVTEQRRPDPAGLRDEFVTLTPAHDTVARLQREFGHVRVGSSADVYKAALTATLGQRITAAEAVNQWARLCRALGTPLDTPSGPLATPPHPELVAAMSPFQFHRFGIEESRARTLIGVAKVFARRGPHNSNPQAALRRLIAEVPRFGPWTRALVEAEALGNPDAVAVGDFHLKNVVAHALTGRPRGTDDEMVRTLAPYSGQRGRVLMWLSLAGVAAPKFGPRRRNIDIRRF